MMVVIITREKLMAAVAGDEGRGRYYTHDERTGAEGGRAQLIHGHKEHNGLTKQVKYIESYKLKQTHTSKERSFIYNFGSKLSSLSSSATLSSNWNSSY